jgi:hypothetical protein
MLIVVITNAAAAYNAWKNAPQGMRQLHSFINLLVIDFMAI